MFTFTSPLQRHDIVLDQSYKRLLESFTLARMLHSYGESNDVSLPTRARKQMQRWQIFDSRHSYIALAPVYRNLTMSSAFSDLKSALDKLIQGSTVEGAKLRASRTSLLH